MQKCHSIIVTGKVHNAKDGSVKILCCVEDSVIDNFTQAIRVRGGESGTEITNIKEKTLSINIDLPDDFSKVSSDDEIDIGRKLDKANSLLKTGFENLNTGFNKLNTDLNRGFSTLTTIMSEHNTRMDEHNKRLEAILEKLADK